MASYLNVMQATGSVNIFKRRVGYIKHNFSRYLKLLNSSNGRVLEIGPGTGELLYVLNHIGLNNIDIIDNDSGVLKHCSDKYDIKKSTLSKSLDISKSLTGSYDLIVLTQVFEHIPKSSYMNWVRELYKVLKPGGSIIITVPNGANPLSGTERYGDLQHENIFTVFSFRELMTFANLPNSSYKIQGFEIPPYNIVNIIRIVLQKLLHAVFILLMIINGAIYQTLMTPNITLIITKDK